MKTTGYVFGLLTLVAVAHAEPVTRQGASYYYIEGASALILTAQMDSKGPAGADGRRHPVKTKWDVQWRYRHNMHGDVCKMEKVMVMVGVTSIRPRWRDEHDAAAALRNRWQKMVKAIDRYDEYHKEQARKAGTEIENALNGLKPAKTCDTLTDDANQVASEIYEKYRAVSRQYDESSDHGRKNGLGLM